MKIFILKMIAFIILLVLLLNLFEFITPYYYGNDVFEAKMNYLKRHAQKYNMVFIGSSRTYRHINPPLFDSLCVGDVKSYNLGSPATFAPESYYLCENLMKDNKLKIKYIILELSTIKHIPDRNLHSVRSKYFYTFNYLTLALNYFAHQAIPFTEKINVYKNLLISYFERIFKVDVLQDMTLSIIKPIQNTHLIEGNIKGYFSCEDDVRMFKKQQLIDRFNKFQKDTTVIKERLRAIQYYHHHVPHHYNKIHLKKIRELIRLARSKGILLIFFLPPRTEGYAYGELIPLMYMIDFNHRIDLSDPQKFPELYIARNCFDIGHYNNRGAELFTKYLVSEVNKIIQR